MDLVVAFGVLAVAVFAGGQLLTRRRRWASRRALKRAKTTPIAALPQGEPVKIIGTVSGRDPMLQSPIGNQPCVGYSTVVEAAAMPQEEWRVVLKSAACASFYLTDDSGTAVVAGAVFFAMNRDGAWEIAPVELFPPATPGERVRFQEILIRPGDRVSVLGRARLEIDPAGRGSFRDPPRLNHITGSEDDPVVIGDEEDLLS